MIGMPFHPQHRKLRLRNIAIAAALGGLVVLFFLITLAKLGA